MNRISNIFDSSLSASFPRFRRNFLLLYSIFSVMEGLWSVFGEYELVYYGIEKEQMVLSLCIGYAAALFLGTFVGVLSGIIGQRKVCLMFCALHLFVALCKRILGHSNLWLASICLPLASSIFSFSLETWMVVDHEKLGYRQESLDEMFWLLTFFESASFIGSQVLINQFTESSEGNLTKFPTCATFLLAILATIFISKGWKEATRTTAVKNHIKLFVPYVFADKHVLVLAWAQACLQFSATVFWVLWAPTIVADGRGVHLGLIYPCLLGARMLGSTGFPWLFGGPLSLRTEECLVHVFILSASILSIVAYDYQEIGVLVALFCLFQSCVGLILPSLARLRTMYVPNELRAGMIGLSFAPANAAILFVLLQRGYYKNIENSTIIGFAAIGLFSAAGCMYLLKRWGKQSHRNLHKL